MSWRIIYVEESERLLLHLDNIKIINGAKEVTVPLSDINTIMIDNTRTMLSVRLINACADNKVALFTCDHRHLPRAVVMPLSGNYRATHILRKQLAWSDERKAHVWQYIVRLKIMHQARVLHITKPQENIAYKRLRQFATDVDAGDTQNCEGLAAKMYFRTIFGVDFLRDEETPINAALNYGYSIIRSQLARALIAHGLNTHLGIFHRGPGNPFNLADDLMEPLRPIIDLWVMRNIEDNVLFCRKNRLDLIALMTHNVVYGTKRVSLIFAINTIVERFMETMETGRCASFTYPDIKTYEL